MCFYNFFLVRSIGRTGGTSTKDLEYKKLRDRGNSHIIKSFNYVTYKINPIVRNMLSSSTAKCVQYTVDN